MEGNIALFPQLYTTDLKGEVGGRNLLEDEIILVEQSCNIC